MSKYKFDAVIFDLDGVITKTALVHSTAWKKMFDGYLHQREQIYGEPFKEFTHEEDYLRYVDGKPRYEGVKSFLESRGIDIPYGDPSDDPGKETVCGLGNRKNKVFNDVLDNDGVEVYESTVSLIRKLKMEGIKTAVASSSKNCKIVLEKAGLADLFETRVDGLVSADLGLKGKPEPDIFITAAGNLGVPCDKTVIVEDAVSGVMAGKKGNFGLVIGIAREGNERELKINGADIVVDDLAAIGFDGIVKWFDEGLEADNFSFSCFDYDQSKEKTRETLLTTGNGYFATRGALEECKAGKINYPGTYIAGVYNRLVSRVGGKNVENEDFVNCPNWLPVRFALDGELPVKINRVEILDIERRLDFKTGLLFRKLIIRDKKGRETEIVSKRFASMYNPHIAALSYELKPLNYSGKVRFESVLDGNILNNGVERYSQLKKRHLKPVIEGGRGRKSFIMVKTVSSGIEIVEAAKLGIFLNDEPANMPVNIHKRDGSVASVFEVDLEQGQAVKIEKIVSLFTSKADDSKFPLRDALNSAGRAGDFDTEFEKSAGKWNEIWNEMDIRVEGDRLAQKLLRMHLYHLIVSFSPHNEKIDASITARGLHGEAYRGHIFWDELFILPLYDIHFPQVAKAALLYRYRRLNEAKKYAAQHGYKGAMFPWQSGSSGKEETQVLHLNPVTGKWGPDYSSLQRHVSLAIAFNIWNYFNITGDIDFLNRYGAEMFFEICRFWASKAVYDEQTGRYSIEEVMGPDEFHEKYPGSQKGGLKDNTYTNVMVVWAFEKAKSILDFLSGKQRKKILEKLNLTQKELDEWDNISSLINLVIKDGIFAQYDGYFDLKELDWNYYREKYGNIYRMDRILKAEGKSPDEYKVAKQADTLQLFYNLQKDQIDSILKKLGYRLPEDYPERNLKYYITRTSHGSTLSRVVHAHLANITGDKKLSWTLYYDALTSDYNDIQGGTTGEGIHAGVMAATVMIAVQSFAGVDLSGDIVKIKPTLPGHWRKISFGFTFKGVRYECQAAKEEVSVVADKSVTVEINSKLREINNRQ